MTSEKIVLKETIGVVKYTGWEKVTQRTIM
jgi:hypothetical protein